jgi:nucleotide-binding universal stress UspA family protein
MTRQIVVPLDGSRLAEMALPHAVAMANMHLYGITLLRAVPSPVVVSSTAWAVAPAVNVHDDWDNEIEAEGEYLEKIAAWLRTKGVEARSVLLEHEPADAIISYVSRHPEASMIVMSTHGRSGLSRWVFGSVTEQVLHSSPLPVFVVRSGEVEDLTTEIVPPIYEHILVPLDGSDFAAQALEPAVEIASRVGAAITLVSAAIDEGVATELVAPPALGGELESEGPRLRDYLGQVAQRLSAQGLNVDTRLEYGPPAEVILRTAEQVHADVIVMATHGRTGIARMWLGSIAIRVVQASTLPVLMVRVTEPIQEHSLEAHPLMKEVEVAEEAPV